MRTIVTLIALSMLAACGSSTTDQRRLERIAAEYEGGNIDTAIKQLNDYVAEYPRDDFAWTLLGHAYADLDRLDEAQAAYEEALAIDPGRFQAITGMGIVHRMRGDYELAMEAYRAALAIDPEYAQAYSSMAIIALRQSQDAKALEYAIRGYELDTTDPVIAANLAVAYHYNGNFDERDRMARVAEQLGYPNLDALRQVFAGEMTIRE